MVRQANPVDFWRGLALVFIFVNHIPGNYFGRFTHVSYSLSDSADLFVFLAGWALRLLVGTPGQQSTWYLVLRLGGRAVTLYAAQIMITMIALAMLAACAILLGNPLLLEWHNAAAVFHDPVTTHDCRRSARTRRHHLPPVRGAGPGRPHPRRLERPLHRPDGRRGTRSRRATARSSGRRCRT